VAQESTQIQSQESRTFPHS